MHDLGYKIGLRLARIRFVREAIEKRADLSEFRQRPTLRILAGMFLIGFSYVICWPAISVLATMSIYFKKPLIVGIGGPVMYVSSHVCFLAGMALTGAKYSRIFFLWATRVGVERLLAFGVAQDPPKP